MAQDPEMEKLDITDELIAERRSEAPGETPEDMHPLSRKIVGNIDIFSNWVGKITCFMLLPVMLSMVYEVVARKLFIAPTDWAYDTSRMFAGAMFMMGAGYALMRGVHIRADFCSGHGSRLIRHVSILFCTCCSIFRRCCSFSGCLLNIHTKAGLPGNVLWIQR